MRAEDLLRERGGVPRCGTPLGGPPRLAAGLASGAPGASRAGRSSTSLAVARRELQMDIALLSEVRDGREIVLWAVGNGRPARVRRRRLRAAARHVCQRLLDGRIDNIVHDAQADARVRDLPAVRGTGLGAYIGVPLTGAAARRYVLCCVAREARPDLLRAPTCGFSAGSWRACARPSIGRPARRDVTNSCIAHTSARGRAAGRGATRSGAGRARGRGGPDGGHPRGDRHDSQGAPNDPGRQPTPPDKREQIHRAQLSLVAASLRAGVQYTRPGPGRQGRAQARLSRSTRSAAQP